jgi:endonuclease/exonuclease/phosphatase (EEP) superfamily protein YafD
MVALLSGTLAFALRRWVFPTASWWPLLMITVLAIVLLLFLRQRRSGAD